MSAAAERPPFVWIKLHPRPGFARLPLAGLFDVADLAAASGLHWGVSADSLELFLAAPPSAQPPLPAAIAAALLGAPLPITAGLAGAGAAPGCWLVARASADALSAALAAAAREREAAHKREFMALMLSISSAGSWDAASHADEARRGAPQPQSAALDEVLGALPAPPSPEDTSSAWKDFAAAHARLPRPSRGKLDENNVHPTIRVLLGAALGRHLRLWCNELAENDVARAKSRPDFTVSHARDAMPSTIGALLVVEVKLPGNLPAACAQARAYLHGSIFKRCAEADERGGGMDGVFAYALATDGCSVVALKMRSGAPPPGASFEGAVPCPVLQSPALPLLCCNFRSAPPAWDNSPPPEGFAALHRLCAAPAAALAAETILTQLSVRLELAQYPPQDGEGGGGGRGSSSGGAAGGLGGGGDSSSCCCSVLLALGARLGCGGSSDVYECTAELGEAAAAAARAPLAVKVSRFSSELVQRCFARERAALLALQSAAARKLVPTLFATGARLGGAADWPLLLLLPCGQSLPSWMAESVAAAVQGGGGGGGGGSGGSGTVNAGVARASCASAVILRLLDALEAAHAASLVHCDVRPSNIVVVRGAGAMLVDWGISRAAGDEARGCGVAAYADRRVFEQGSYLARPAQDVIGALLTWLCLAHSEQCEAPWCITGPGEVMYAAREEWMAKRSSASAAVARVVAALQRAAAQRSWAGNEKRLYALAREAIA